VSETALANYKRYEPPGVDQIPARETLHSEIHKIINSVWNKERWKECIAAPIYKNRR
jgi:hypothetical protein